MPTKTVETPYPLIDADPHASRVIRYFRASDYATWAAATAAFPSALYLWGIVVLSVSQQSLTSPAEMADRSNTRIRTSLRLGGLLGFVGGFLLAYQRSSCGFTVAVVYVSSCSRMVIQSVSGVGRKISGRKTWIWPSSPNGRRRASLSMANQTNPSGYKAWLTEIQSSLNSNSVRFRVLDNTYSDLTFNGISAAFPMCVTHSLQPSSLT